MSWARVTHRLESERARDNFARRADALEFGSQQYAGRGLQFIETFQLISDLAEAAPQANGLLDSISTRLRRAPFGLDVGWFATSSAAEVDGAASCQQLGFVDPDAPTTEVFELAEVRPGSEDILDRCLMMSRDKALEFSGRVTARTSAGGTEAAGLWLYQPVFVGDEVEGVAVGHYLLGTLMRLVFADLDQRSIRVYMFDMPRDRLESLLGKPEIETDDRWLIGFDGATSEPIYDFDLESLKSERNGDNDDDWEDYIRSFALADREIAMLVLPKTEALVTWNLSAWARAIGLVATAALCLYLKTKIDRARVMEDLMTDLRDANATSAKAQAQAQQKAEELERALDKLSQAQSQLVQNEKMSSLGQMAAGIAHEINNPVNFIHGNLGILEEYVNSFLELIDEYDRIVDSKPPELEELIEDLEIEFLTEDTQSIVRSMKLGTQRIRDIVSSMRTFSRMGSSGFSYASLAENLHSTLTILGPRLKQSSLNRQILVEEEFDDVPSIYCCSGELNQVFVNLIVNGLDAIEERFSQTDADEIDDEPHLEIAIQSKPDGVSVIVADNGSGLDPANINKIFDPFFTTKPVGKGTGLGLSISYRIVVEHHSGKLICGRNPGGGTRFEVYLPTLKPEDLEMPSLPKKGIGDPLLGEARPAEGRPPDVGRALQGPPGHSVATSRA